MIEEEKARAQLAAIFKDNGLKDDIKKYLRMRLAQRLQNPVEGNAAATHGFSHRLVVSAVKEHLERIGCHFSASLFGAESGYEEKILERRELKELLSVNSIDDSQTVLEYLFAKVTRSDPFLKHKEIQTEEASGTVSIQDKLSLIDIQFRKALQDRNHQPQSKAHSCQQQKLWYQRELARFREFQAHKVKIKVGQEWRIKFQAYAAEMEAHYTRKIDKLRQREKILVEELTRKQKNLQEKIQNWQLSAKSRMQLIQIKEITSQRQRENLQIQRKKASDQLKKTINEAKDKSREYQNLILNTQKRIAYEVGLAKLSQQQLYTKKQQQFRSKKKFVEEEYDKLMRIKQGMGFVQKENDRLVKQNDEIRKQNQEIKKELRDIRNQILQKSDRIQSIKEEFHELQLDRQEIVKKYDAQSRMRKKREEELVISRKELERLRLNIISDQSESSIEEAPPRFSAKEVADKMSKFREQRKKEIQRFKLQL